MNKKRLLCFLLSIMMILAGCSKQNKANPANSNNQGNVSETQDQTETPQPTETSRRQAYEQSKYLVAETIQSKALANNILDEPTERDVYICLPPSYFESDKRYPVVYYLHGLGAKPSAFPMASGMDLFKQFTGGAKEFILVCVDGDCKSNMGTSFYVNSPVIGNWEDYVVDEVVSYIDENYRTIAERDSRGICGFSMGGFGSLNLALRHPDIYSSVFAISPCFYVDEDIESAIPIWKEQLMTGIARAFSPKVDDPDKIYGNIPKMDHSSEDAKIIKDYKNGLGNLNQKLDDYVALNMPLKAIWIRYGEEEPYGWIPRACQELAKGMDDRNIEYVVDSHSGGHIVESGVMEGQIVPFFDSNLVFDE